MHSSPASAERLQFWNANMFANAQSFWGQLSFRAKLAAVAALLCLVLTVWLLRPGGTALQTLDLAMQGGVNRHVPAVTAPSSKLQFSTNPNDAEFLRAGVFLQPLAPVGHTTSEENRALATAVIQYDDAALRRKEPDAVEPLLAFLNAHPRSAWRPALLVNLAMIYRQTGHFTKAMTVFQQAWAESKGLTDANGRIIGDTTIAEYTQFLAYLGRKETLAPLLAEIAHRPLRGAAAEKVVYSSRGLDEMLHQPQISFRCGPLALLRILLHQKTPSPKAIKVLSEAKSTPNGLSLTMVQGMSAKAGMGYQMAYRSPGAPIITASVVNWKTGHYAAIIGTINGRYLIEDATFGHEISVSQATLDQEASGYFLVPAGKLPDGWRPVSSIEGDKLWGRGNTGNAVQPGGNGPNSGTPANPGCGTEGCTTWNIEAMTVSLLLHDRPLSYKPPIGPEIDIDIDYSHRDIEQPGTFNYANMG